MGCGSPVHPEDTRPWHHRGGPEAWGGGGVVAGVTMWLAGEDPPRVSARGGALALGGSSGRGHAAVSLGHVTWCMRHSHTRAPRTNGETKRAETMVKPPLVQEGYSTRISCCRISRRLGVHDHIL